MKAPPGSPRAQCALCPHCANWNQGGTGFQGAGQALSVLCSQGDQFLFYEDWGENMVSKGTPVLCVLDIESGNISVLEGVPESVSPGQVSADLACITPGVWGPCLSDCPLFTPAPWSCLQAFWAPGDTGVVFAGWWHEPFRLGIRFCTNRR